MASLPDFVPGTRVLLALPGQQDRKMTYLGDGVFIIDQADRDGAADEGLREIAWDEEVKNRAVVLPGMGVPAGDYIAVAEVNLAYSKGAGMYQGLTMPGQLRAAS